PDPPVPQLPSIGFRIQSAKWIRCRKRYGVYMIRSAPTCSPEAIAAAALDIGASEIVAVERIKHGLTHDSWRVRTGRGAVIVRSSNASAELLRIDRLSEARVLALVASAGIGPEVLVCDPARHVLVTRDLGETWCAEDAHVSANIERIAQ